MLNKAIITLITAILGGILYRVGGTSAGTKWRDLGLPALSIGLLTLLNGWNWTYILCFGLYFGSLTTYWKQKGTDAKWYHWLMTGFGYSLAFLPFAFVSGLWFGFALRCVMCSILIMIASEKISNATLEEFARGFIATITLLLLLI